MDLVTDYIDALFLVFTVVIFVRILMSWIQRPPIQPFWRAIWDFFLQSTEWYLSIFRRVIPPLGMFDLSPIVALIVLFILRGLVVSLLGSF
jgi:YggT family protein